MVAYGGRYPRPGEIKRLQFLERARLAYTHKNEMPNEAEWSEHYPDEFELWTWMMRYADGEHSTN